jgi:hypothetical protein
MKTSRAIRREINRTWKRYGYLVRIECGALAKDTERHIEIMERAYVEAVRREGGAK